MGGPAAKKMKGAGGKGIVTAEAGSGIGEIRYDKKHHAVQAANRLNGQPLLGCPLDVQLDPTSKDGCKLIVTGIPDGCEWQELKDHFGKIGTVAFANVKGGVRKGARLTGEVRFDDPAVSAQAVEMLNGSEMEGGGQIGVTLDPKSKDNTKLIVTGIPPGCGWKELKDHFAQVGTPVAFAALKGPGLAGGVGEVRYDNPNHARMAAQQLNGSNLGGHNISVTLDPGSVDGSKLIVTGIGPGIEWQELKDHFKHIGTVAFAEVGKGKGKGKGKGGMGGGKGGGGGDFMMEKMMEKMGQQMMQGMMQKMMGNMMSNMFGGGGGGGKFGGKGGRW